MAHYPFPLDDPLIKDLAAQGYHWLTLRKTDSGEFVMIQHPDGREVELLRHIPHAFRLPNSRRILPTSILLRTGARIELPKIPQLKTVIEPIMADLTANGFMRTRVLDDGGNADITLGNKQRLMIDAPHMHVRALLTNEHERVDVNAEIESLTLRGLHSAQVNLYAPARKGGTHIRFTEAMRKHTLRLHGLACKNGLSGYEDYQFYMVESTACNVNIVLSNRFLLAAQDSFIEIDHADHFVQAHVVFHNGGREPLFAVNMEHSISGPIRSIRIGDEGAFIDMSQLGDAPVMVNVNDALFAPQHVGKQFGMLYQPFQKPAHTALLA